MRLRPQDLRGATSRRPGTQAVSAFTIPGEAAANQAPAQIDLLDFGPLLGPLGQMAKDNQNKNNEALRAAGRAFAKGREEKKTESQILKQLTESGRTPEQVKKYLQKLVESGKLNEADNPAFLLGFQERIGEAAHDAYRSKAIAAVERGDYTDMYSTAPLGTEDDVDAQVLADLQEKYGEEFESLGFYAAMAADPLLMDTNRKLLDAAAGLGRERKIQDYRNATALYVRERADEIALNYLDGDEDALQESLKKLGERYDADSLVLKGKGAIDILEKSLAKSFRRLAINPAVGPEAAGEALEDTLFGVVDFNGNLVLEMSDNATLWNLRKDLQLQGERDKISAAAEAEREEKAKFKELDEILYDSLSVAAGRGGKALFDVSEAIIELVEQGGMGALQDAGLIPDSATPDDYSIDNEFIADNIRKYVDDRVGKFRQKSLDSQALRVEDIQNEIIGLGYNQGYDAAVTRLRDLRNDGRIEATEYKAVEDLLKKAVTKDNSLSWQRAQSMGIFDSLFDIVKASVAEDNEEWQELGPAAHGKLEIEMYDELIGHFTALADSVENRPLNRQELLSFQKEMSDIFVKKFPALSLEQRRIAQSAQVPSEALRRTRIVDEARVPADQFNQGRITVGGLKAGDLTTPASYKGITDAVSKPLVALKSDNTEWNLDIKYMNFQFGENEFEISRGRILAFYDALDELEEDEDVTPAMFQTAMKDAWLKSGTMRMDTFGKPAAERADDFAVLNSFGLAPEDRRGPYRPVAEEMEEARREFPQFQNYRVEPAMLFGARFNDFRDVTVDQLIRSVGGESLFTDRYTALFQDKVVALLEMNNLPIDARTQREFIKQQVQNWRQ